MCILQVFFCYSMIRVVYKTCVASKITCTMSCYSCSFHINWNLSISITKTCNVRTRQKNWFSIKKKTSHCKSCVITFFPICQFFSIMIWYICIIFVKHDLIFFKMGKGMSNQILWTAFTTSRSKIHTASVLLYFSYRSMTQFSWLS